MSKVLLAIVVSCLSLIFSAPAYSGIITAQGSVTAMTNVSQFVGTTNTVGFDEGPANTFVPLAQYSALGMTLHTGALTSILSGVTTAGSASNRPYLLIFSQFPGPIAGGGQVSGFAGAGGVATFSHSVTQFGVRQFPLTNATASSA